MEYKFLKAKFRHYWLEGLSAIQVTKKYFNLLIGWLSQMNDCLSIRDILRIILTENCDLPGITHWKLVSNLGERYKRKYRSRL